MRIALVVLLLALCACGPDAPAGLAFSKVDLPAGAAPTMLSVAGDTVLIGVRRDGQPVVPGLLEQGPDGVVTDVPVKAESQYGKLAKWYSIDSDGKRILAIGGERGGAHANVRWSVWHGSTSDLAEKTQGFSTFGGWGAGEMVGAVLTPGGAVLIGSWQSAQAGLDIAVWTVDGDVWTRQSSAGTVLESNRQTLGFPSAVTALRQGILIVGLQLTNGKQAAAVWQSAVGNTGWTRTALPDAGQIANALAVRCWGEACAIVGVVDGKLAVWRLSGDKWVRDGGVPAIAVSDKDKLASPIDLDGHLSLIVTDGGHPKLVRADGDKWMVKEIAGPPGPVTAVVKAGKTVYLLAGPDDGAQTLWRADAGSLS